MGVKRFAPLILGVAITGLITVLAFRSSLRVGNTPLAIWELQKIFIFALATLIVTRILRLALGLLRFTRAPIVSPTQNAWITFALAAAYFLGMQLLRRPTYASVVEATGLLPLPISSGILARMTNAVMMLPGLLLWLNMDLLRADKGTTEPGGRAELAAPPGAIAKSQG
jgi:hypothetical protein